MKPRAKFLTPLRLQYIDGRTWKLEAPLEFRSVVAGCDLTVPAAFKTDFASIPRLFWRLLPPAGAGEHSAYGPAAVIHDYLYRTKSLPRAVADAVFLEAMAVLGVGYLTRYTFYWAVRAFGWPYYGR